MYLAVQVNSCQIKNSAIKILVLQEAVLREDVLYKALLSTYLDAYSAETFLGIHNYKFVIKEGP